MWVMGEWAVGHWIVGVTSFQKIYGLYGLKHFIVEISGDVTKAGRTDNQTRKDRATHGLWKAEMSKKTFRKYWENFFRNYALFYMQGVGIFTDFTVY